MQDPEARIAPFAVRGTQAITSVEGLVVQGASKALPKVGAIADKYPLLSELFVSGAINTAGYQFASGKEFSGDNLLKTILTTALNKDS